MNKGILEHPVIHLSKYVMINKDDYYHHLSGVTQRGAWKPWVMYILDAVEKTAVLINQLITNIFNQMEATPAHGKTTIKWYNKEVNEVIFSPPYIKPKFIGEILGSTSRTTLTKCFGKLVAANILSPSKDAKSCTTLTMILYKF